MCSLLQMVFLTWSVLRSNSMTVYFSEKHCYATHILKFLRFCIVIVKMLITFLFCLMLLLLQGVTNIICIKVLLNMILEWTFSLTKWCHYKIVCLNCFKSRLDKFWTNQDVLYNWEADFTVTGSLNLEALPASVNFCCLVYLDIFCRLTD